MTPEINDEAAAVIDAILEALDIPYPATAGDQPHWLRCLSGRVMHAVIALRMIRENSAEPAWHLARLQQRLAAYPPAYRTWHKPQRPSGEIR